MVQFSGADVAAPLEVGEAFVCAGERVPGNITMSPAKRQPDEAIGSRVKACMVRSLVNETAQEVTRRRDEHNLKPQPEGQNSMDKNMNRRGDGQDGGQPWEHFPPTWRSMDSTGVIRALAPAVAPRTAIIQPAPQAFCASDRLTKCRVMLDIQREVLARVPGKRAGISCIQRSAIACSWKCLPTIL